MQLTSPKTIKEILEKYDATPSKTMGQNFLVNAPALAKIIAAADLDEKDTILEIGPGIGTLTQELAKKAGKVIAIEKDKVMVEILQETLRDFNNIEIAPGDALKFDPKSYKLEAKSYKLIANLPYYITSPVIRKFLESPHQPDFMVLMVQKEVAQRICAKPPEMSILAVSVQFYAAAKIVSYVSKGCFWPIPNVDSAIIKIIPRDSALISANFRDTFFKVVKAGFLHPRKQLINNLSVGLTKKREDIHAWLLSNNLESERRAETLTLQNWIDLTKTL